MSDVFKMINATKEAACRTAEADAIREKTGGTTPLTYDFDNGKGFADEIAAIPSGTEITDGIVVKARNANGYPTEIDYYVGGTCYPNQFYQGYNGSSWNLNDAYPWGYLETINVVGNPQNLKVGCLGYHGGNIVGDFSNVTYIDGDRNESGSGNSNIFSYSGIESISLDNLTYLCGTTFVGCKSLKNVYCPKCAAIYSKWDAGANRATFGNCTALESVQSGSIGTQCLLTNNQPFIGCTNANLVVTLYCEGDNVDTQLAYIRNGATQATIIIKASKNTTYNGTAYSAGETILTSTPT